MYESRPLAIEETVRERLTHAHFDFVKNMAGSFRKLTPLMFMGALHLASTEISRTRVGPNSLNRAHYLADLARSG